MTRQIKKGAENVSVELYIIDDSDGTPELGVLWNTAGIDLNYRRDGEAVSSITEKALSTPALTDAHDDGGFLEIANGRYRLDVPDAAWASGADQVTIGGTVTGMIVLPVTVQLVDFDPTDAAKLGLTDLGDLRSALIAAKGTADSGSSTTLLDAALTQADDFWNEHWLHMLTGAAAGQGRLITDFEATPDRLTVNPAFGGAIGAGDEYVIFPVGRIHSMAQGILASSFGESSLGAIANALSTFFDLDDVAKVATAAHLYHADIEITIDDANTKDEYTVTWFKNGVRVTSGITGPTIQVVQRADGLDLVGSTAMSQIGTTGSYKYDEPTNRITDGEAVLVLAAATIDGAARTFARVFSTNST